MTSMQSIWRKSFEFLHLQCESIPPCGFLTFLQNGWEFLINFYAPIIVPFYTRLQNIIQLFPTLTKLCHTKRDHLSIFLHFTRTFTSKSAYWTNDVNVDVMSYPICLLTLQKCLFYSDLRKHLNACVSADGGHFEHITWTRSSRLIWHNFAKVGVNWIKICNLA